MPDLGGFILGGSYFQGHSNFTNDNTYNLSATFFGVQVQLGYSDSGNYSIALGVGTVLSDPALVTGADAFAGVQVNFQSLNPVNYFSLSNYSVDLVANSTGAANYKLANLAASAEPNAIYISGGVRSDYCTSTRLH